MGHQRTSESCLLCMNTHPATILNCMQRTNSRPLEVSTCKSDSRWICNLLHSNRLVRKLYHDDQTETNLFFKICIFTIHHHTLPYLMTCLLWANPWDFWHKGQVIYSFRVSSFTMMLTSSYFSEPSKEAEVPYQLHTWITASNFQYSLHRDFCKKKYIVNQHRYICGSVIQEPPTVHFFLTYKATPKPQKLRRHAWTLLTINSVQDKRVESTHFVLKFLPRYSQFKQRKNSFKHIHPNQKNHKLDG